MNAPQPVAPPKLPGVIDTLSAAYQTLNRHLYLLLVPMVLDLFYWLGPRLSVQPVAERMVQALQDVANAPEIGVTTAQAAQSVDMLKSVIESMGKGMNLFSLLSSALSIPSLLASQDLQPPAGVAVATARTIAAFADLLWLGGLLFVLGVALGAVYLGLVAQVVRDGRVQPGVLAQRVLVYAVRYVGLLLMLALAALIVGLPASLVVGFVTLLNPLVGAALMFVVWMAILWLYFNLMFVVNALFVSEAGPLRAVLSSITVVRLSTSSAIGLLLIIWIISWGMGYVWNTLGASAMATLVSIVGNAYIGSGLAIASMIFYRDRISAILSRLRPAVPNQ